MMVNGLELPTSFVQLASAIGRRELPDNWMLKEDVDAYGDPWQADIEVFYDMERITSETAELAGVFQPCYEAEVAGGYCVKEPGFIPYIWDFSKIVQFGRTGGDAMFCFDYRDDLQQPSVIHWTDAYWRRVAPDIEAFVGLFEPFEGDKYLQRAKARGELWPSFFENETR
jgi:hypothetical protein